MKLRGSSLLKFQEREAKTTLYNKDFVSRVCLWTVNIAYKINIHGTYEDIHGTQDLRFLIWIS